jgi:hypothetical protein
LGGCWSDGVVGCVGVVGVVSCVVYNTLAVCSIDKFSIGRTAVNTVHPTNQQSITAVHTLNSRTLPTELRTLITSPIIRKRYIIRTAPITQPSRKNIPTATLYTPCRIAFQAVVRTGLANGVKWLVLVRAIGEALVV